MNHQLKRVVRPWYRAVRKLLGGRSSLMELAFARKTYFAQFGEDIFLDQYFQGKNRGFYVDIGAFHPFWYSNTYIFYKRGWSGINVEPNPISFRSFPKMRDRDINLNVAVDLERGERQFNCANELSGIDGDTHLFRKQHRDSGSHQCTVLTVPLSSILDEHLPDAETIDFISIDCE